MIITLIEAKLYLNITDTDTSKDDLLEMLINQASAYIESITNRYVTPTQKVETFDIFCYKEYSSVLLRHTPVVEIISVQNSSDKIFSVENTTDITDTSVFIEPFEVLIPNTKRYVKITYNSGYTEIPEPFKQVALEFVWVRFQQIQGIRIDLSSKGISANNVVNSTNNYKDMYAEWERLLLPYKRLVSI